MKNYDAMAQKVWAATNVNEKRAIINEMIDSFQYPAKADTFRRQAATASANRLDQMAANLMLNDTDAVVK
jgi:hypothetical protein